MLAVRPLQSPSQRNNSFAVGHKETHDPKAKEKEEFFATWIFV